LGPDDSAFAAGVGFTDIVKRPTKARPRSAHRGAVYGAELLRAKLTVYEPQLVIFTFKQTAEMLLGNFAGNGFVPGLKLARSEVFVMPGPYEKADKILADTAAASRALGGQLRWT
jgi:double-stranded uracil-DNA glycosylase